MHKLKTFLLCYLLPFLCITLAFYLTWTRQSNQKIEQLIEEEVFHVTGQDLSILRSIDSVISDLSFLSRIKEIEDFQSAESLDEEDRKQIESIFSALANSRACYDQIRILSKDGMEAVRVNWSEGGSRVVKTTDLQNKKGRYYFEDTFKLPPGKVFISPLDLNVEHGQIELPHKPMLRFGISITNNKGEKTGIILINYLAEELFERIRQALYDTEGQFSFLNSSGFWLFSQQPGLAWGFQLPNMYSVSFARHFPKVWERIRGSRQGHFHTEKGIFVYKKVYPLSSGTVSSTGSATATGNSLRQVELNEYFWVLVSHIPDEKVREILKPSNTNMFLLWFIFILLQSLFSFFLIHALSLRRKAVWAKQKAEEKYRILFEQAGESIVVANGLKTILSNPRTENLFGYTQDELLSLSLILLVFPDDREFVKERYEKISSGENFTDTMEFRIQTKDGSIKWVEMRASKLNLGDGSVLCFFLDSTRRKEMELQLQEMATRDSMTSLLNRRAFFDAAERETARSRRYETPLSVVMIDADHFKQINDNYGHSVGDDVLKYLSELILLEARETDVAARFGGEEFVVLLPGATMNSARSFAERLRLRVEQSPVESSGGIVNYTVSIGCAFFKLEENIEMLVARADEAMYQAKKAGRNRVFPE